MAAAVSSVLCLFSSCDAGGLSSSDLFGSAISSSDPTLIDY